MSKDKELIVRSRNKRPREGVYHEGWIVLNAPAPETLPVDSATQQEKKHTPSVLNTETQSEAVSGRTADSDEAALHGQDAAVPAQVPKNPRKMVTLDDLSPGRVERGKKSAGECARVSVSVHR